MKKYIVTCVDYGDTCDGKARVLGVFNTRMFADLYVKKDISRYVDDNTYDDECCFENVDFRGMSVYTHNRENGCEWNISEIDVDVGDKNI